MFSFEQIARWLTFPIDPITVEDWVANREIFGAAKKESEQEKELERAFQIESIRQNTSEDEVADDDLVLQLVGKEAVGIVDAADFLLLAPAGRVDARAKTTVMAVEVNADGGKPVKARVLAGNVEILPVEKINSLKIKISMGAGLKIDGKSGVSWSGGGKTKLVFDGRGRPVGEIRVGPGQMETMRKLSS